MNEILNSQPFLIVISGVLIFTIQKLITELWIVPIVKFNDTRGKIEILILRYAYLTQASLGISEKLDNEIWLFRDELRNLTGCLVAAYNNLPFLEKVIFKRFSKIDTIEAKGPLIGLSNIVASPSDASRPTTLASEYIDKIRKSLNFID